jgi:hypothetical protein
MATRRELVIGGAALAASDIIRYRHLADVLSKSDWTIRQVEKALGGDLMRVYGESFG